MQDAAKGIGKRAAAYLMWRRGNLRYKLDSGRKDSPPCTYCHVKHGGQKDIYDAIKASPGEKWFLGMSRRRGKTFLLCVLAAEYAITHPNSQIHYAAATAKAVKKMVRPNFRKVFADAPEELRPVWNSVDGEYRFKNGSVITVAGCDNGNYELLRGTESHLVIVDEAGFIDDLQAVVDDVLMPMTLETDATIIISSTPPKSLDHYAVELSQECRTNGRYFHQTVYDNPRLSLNQVAKFIMKLAGARDLEAFKKTNTFKREMLGEFVADTEALVIPEFTDVGHELIRPTQRPAYFDTYISSDIGYRDGWGILFAYWDFREAKLVIEDEILYFKTKTAVVAEGIKRKRDALWKAKNENVEVYRLISDNDLLTIADLSEHGLFFAPTKKDEKENQVNRVREWVASRKIIIHPRCVHLISQLQNTIWNERRDDFVRTKTGHGDMLDALIYLCRNIDRHHNPFPKEPGLNPENYFVNPHNQDTPEDSVVLDMLGLRGRLARG